MRWQEHGFTFETYIKQAFPNADTNEMSVWDIETDHEVIDIKATRSFNSIALASIGKWQSLKEQNKTLRLIVGATFDTDSIQEIREFVITPSHLQQILGSMSFSDIFSLLDSISLSNFPIGKSDEARTFAKAKIQEIQKDSKLMLRPSISDNYSQRRIQCSIHGKDLRVICGFKSYSINDTFMGLPVNIKIK